MQRAGALLQSLQSDIPEEQKSRNCVCTGCFPWCIPVLRHGGAGFYDTSGKAGPEESSAGGRSIYGSMEKNSTGGRLPGAVFHGCRISGQQYTQCICEKTFRYAQNSAEFKRRQNLLCAGAGIQIRCIRREKQEYLFGMEQPGSYREASGSPDWKWCINAKAIDRIGYRDYHINQEKDLLAGPDIFGDRHPDGRREGVTWTNIF